MLEKLNSVSTKTLEKMEAVNGVLVIGGGIAGMQAALDIANQMIQVYLVDHAPAIGGAMAKLDKTLPTNDCAICIEAPKMVEVGRNEHIEIITYANITKLEGTIGNFTVTIEENPRYIDTSKCSGCGDCFEVCPVKVPNEFDHKLSLRGAIYRYFPQAVPNIATIDMDYCINCGLCELVCVPDAINRNDKPKIREIKVYAIIVATGFEEFDPTVKRNLGYGIYPNIITGTQFERLLSASGPTEGQVRRLSDGKIPKNIAWIQCVGSRDVTINQPYCSRVCCIWATKQAMIAKEHHPEINTYIFYMDLRAYGKGFEEYYQRGKYEAGINYIRSRPAEINETDNRNLIIYYEDIISAKAAELDVDLVVLSSAIKAPESNKQLAETLGVELDKYGFFKEKAISSPLETTVDGIYLCGCSAGPKDIPDSVSQASGAASKALAIVAETNFEVNKEVVKETGILLQDIRDEEPRIGVFICHCGRNIGGYLDVEDVTKYAKKLPNVEFATNNLFTCSEATQTLIKKAIQDNKLNRIVVASCSPRTHESLFRTTCKEAGLNESLFEMANIRDQCSWVHSHEWKNATDKAKDLTAMAIAKARLLKPSVRKRLKVIPEALVIGGGIAGLTAANDLAKMGFDVHLVEKERYLGGLLRDMTTLFPTNESTENILKEKIKNISNNPKIHTYLNTTIENVGGFIGNFKITLSGDNNKKIEVGTVIIATGGKEFKPIGYYGYSLHKNIMTLLEFDQALKKKKKLPKNITNIFLISCVGSKEKEISNRTYCCRVGCAAILKTARRLSEVYPNAHIHILHQDIRLVEKIAEEYYSEVRKLPQVYFIRYKEENKPNVVISESGITISFHNIFTGEDYSYPADLILLTTPLVNSSSAKELSQLFKVPLGTDGFFQEAHIKLRPLDFATDGIYVCGTAHSPKNVSDSISQASGAAARASIPMRLGQVVAETNIATVDPTLCVGCGTCGSVCPYGAISFHPIDLISHVNEAICKGCGVCAVTCPAKAITMQGFTDLQILNQISEALHGSFPADEPKIVGFCCNWCSYAGADLAGISRFQYPSNIRIIRVMCSGRIDPFFLLWAFLEGADGVFVSGCHPGDCHYITGNLYAKDRIEKMKKALSSIGIDSRRLTLEWISASEAKRFTQLITEFTELIKSLGPLEPLYVETRRVRGKIHVV